MDLLNPVGASHPSQLSGEGSRAEEETSDTGTYVEGAEYIPLPSKGVFYTWNREYVGLDKLKVRQLNYSDEDILTTQSYLQDGSVFLELLKNVIVDENKFSANGLIPIDRDTILLWLRSTAFGNIFDAETHCPSCQEKQHIQWDISTFKIPEYEDYVLKELSDFGEYNVECPISKLNVKIFVPSIGKSKEYEKALAVKKKNLNIKSDLIGTGGLMLIVSAIEVDGKLLRKKSEIESHFKKINLPLVDSRYIIKQFEKINLQYDTKQDIVCPNCEYVQEDVEMSLLHPNFLWVQS